MKGGIILLLDDIVGQNVNDLEHMISCIKDAYPMEVTESFLDEDEQYVLSDFLYNKEKFGGYSFF